MRGSRSDGASLLYQAIQRQADSGVSEILGGLFIGNELDGTRDGHAYDMVVNVTPSIPFHRRVKNPVRIPVNDDPREWNRLFKLITNSEILDEIHYCMEEGENVLVHCQAGVQRSPAVVACYLIKYRGMTPEAAVDFIKERRTIAFYYQVNMMQTLQLMHQHYHFIEEPPKRDSCCTIC